MLLNFCNPNQQLAAINIDGSTLTLFYRPDSGFENDAFTLYLIDTFKIRKLPGSVPSERNHDTLFHAESYHLMRLAHSHLNFGYPIDKKLGTSLLEATKKYQSVNATSVALKRSYEEKVRQRSFSLVESFYRVVNYLKNYKIKRGTGLPFLTSKNLKRLEEQFSKLSAREFSSTPQIINFLNTTINQHNLTLTLAPPMPLQQRLVVNTCQQLNDFVGAQDEAVNTMFFVWNCFTATVSGISVLYVYSRWVEPMIAALEAPAQPAAPRIR